MMTSDRIVAAADVIDNCLGIDPDLQGFMRYDDCLILAQALDEAGLLAPERLSQECRYEEWPCATV